MRWCPGGDFFGDFWVLHFQRAAHSTFQTCNLNSTRATPCVEVGPMVDIQSPTAEIRRGKKKERKNKPQGKNIMSASATHGGHNNVCELAYEVLVSKNLNILTTIPRPL